MDDGYSLISVIIFIAFILLDAVFYGFGAAIQNVNVSNLEKQMEEGDRKAAKLLHVVNRPGRFVNAIQITTNLIGILTGAFVLNQLKDRLVFFLNVETVGAGLLLAAHSLVGICLIVLLITFGIVVPKRCAAKEPENWGYRMFPLVNLVMTLLLPFIWLVTGLSHLVLRLAGIDPNASDDNVTEEDIMSMVNEGHEQGVLEASEAEMITNIFEMDDKEASDIMTHRKNITALDGEITLEEAADFILKVGNNSRFPVYRKDIDDVMGVLHMKDALIFMNQDEENGKKQLCEIPGLLRAPHFIPETRNINTLFKEMQSQKIHMVIVVDEYGQTAGIVTMEDILEEIVGNIMDEYDVDEEFIAQLEDGSYLLNGMAFLEDVSDTLFLEFKEEDYENYDTINGFLISRLGYIPQLGEEPEVSYGGYNFKIIRVENKIIHTVKVTHIQDESESDS